MRQEDLASIIRHFNIVDIYELKKLAREKKIRKLKGFNSKTEMALLRGIKLLESKPGSMPIGIAFDFAAILINQLKAWPQICQVLLVGELRRGVEEVRSIELLVDANIEETIEVINQISLVFIDSIEDAKIKLGTPLGIPLLLHFSSTKSWGNNSILTTGSSKHLQALSSINEGLPVFPEENEVYKYLGLPWIPPEIRETGFEIQIAQENLLPKLIDLKDIKGDLHLHSKWSDGSNTIEEIINKGIKLGYDYITITDHSQSLEIAGGLKSQDLLQQIVEINNLQLRFPQIQILKGAEVDILPDGSLDFTDDILKKLDIVIASVHSHFHMKEIEMTRRITTALKHPLVKILAHPTGRVLGKRPGYNVDIKEIIKTAASNNKILEVNASPDRLDLRDEHLQYAKTQSVKIAINTDAHHIDRMHDMYFGVQTAKRGWQTNEDIVNSWCYEKLKQYLLNI